MKRKIKLLYHEDGRMLWSKCFPDVPPVQISANLDMIMVSNYQRQMREAIRQAVPVENPEQAKMHIAFDHPIKKGTVYEIEVDYVVNSLPHGYSITIVDPPHQTLQEIYYGATNK